MKDEELLKLYGWVVVCETPLEIEHIYSGSFASRDAADIVIESLENKESNRMTILNYLENQVEIWKEQE